MKQKQNWVAWLMHNYRLTFLLVAAVFLLGIFGLDKMPKAEFPDFTIRQGVVVAVYPGATAEEIEMQVARPLERYLFTFEEVKRKKTTSTSSNGLCTIMVELHDEVDDMDEVWSKIRHGLNSYKSQLPQGVITIIVNDDFDATSATLVAISSEQRSYRELKEYADDLADELRRIELVDNVTMYGETAEQISIYVDRERLSAYGIGQLQLMQALGNAGLTTMSGSITNWQKNIPIHITPLTNCEQEVENIVIFSDKDNNVIRVKDIAEVRREYDTSDSYIEFNSQPCAILSLEMLKGNNIIEYGEKVKQVIDDYTASSLPDDVTIQCITDQSKVVDASVKDFLKNLVEAMVIIILVMLILFPWRTALVAGAIVPLSTFCSVGIMYMCNIPLNIITLAGLIVVLGMVVDNAIVVLDGYLEYLNKGMSRWMAACRSVEQYFMPMMLATICLCAIFFPTLITTTGMISEMCYYMPWTLTINLGVSLALAVIVLPIWEVAFIRKRKITKNKHVDVPKPTSRVGDVTEDAIKKNPDRKSITDFVQLWYNAILAWTFRHPWKTIAGGILLVIVSIVVITPNLKVRMLPLADRNQFAVEITLPEGKGLAETKSIADSVAGALRQDKRVVSVTSFIGCSSPRFHTSYAPKAGGRHYAQLIVNTVSTKATEEVLEKFEPMSDHFPNGFVKFKQLDYQIFTPFEFRFYGENADSLHRVADDVMRLVRQDSRVMNVRTDWDDPRPYIEVDLDPVTSAQLGINRTLAELELALNTGEMQVGQIWEGDYKVPLILKDSHTEDLNYNDVNDIYMSAGPNSVPLRHIGNAEPSWGETRILHRNGVRCITVGLEPKFGVYSNGLQDDFRQLIETQIDMPNGVRFEVGGEPEDDAEVSVTIVESLLISLIIVFFFLLFSFRTYKLTFVSIGAIAFAFPGMLLGLWIAGRPIGVTAMFGVITLMGMIMRNEILIFEHAEGLRKEGWSARDAAFDAGRRRMVPIFLTTATTAVGVVPMIVAATSFWMPVGVSIFAGGIGALIMVVTMLPVIYWKLYEKKEDSRRHNSTITQTIKG
ncbi:MAG: efflux RND transporter permease subunit [Bacteroidales bacterium]|nr:efflux RND transporter permease subunit [Bacteroidales bacterium]